MQPQAKGKHLFNHPAKCIAAFVREALTGVLPVTRDLAQRLLAYEAVIGRASKLTEPAAFRVYEKLRQPLCALAGVGGFRSLATRALTLAKAEAPSLGSVKITPDGYLQGLDEVDTQMGKNQAGGGGVILIAQLLGLLHTFIGESLTLRLVEDVWPDAAFDVIPRTGEKHERTR